MARTPELELTRDALASSTLSHGLHLLGDRWTVAVILGAFLGLRRFEQWQTRLEIPRHTLSERLKALSALGLIRPRPYQLRPLRHDYHLTARGMALYPHVLMMWSWERRWGARSLSLPGRLQHRRCGQDFVPLMVCEACDEKVGISDLRLSLQVVASLLPGSDSTPRAVRLGRDATEQMGLGLRVDRWSLLIVSAVTLGCRYFDELSLVLGIGSSVLARRLAGMVDSGLLQCQTDLQDARRRVYRLTPASRDLFGYIICFSSWASRHQLQQPSSIRTTHKACGQPFVPKVVCSHCRERLLPWDVQARPS